MGSTGRFYSYSRRSEVVSHASTSHPYLRFLGYVEVPVLRYFSASGLIRYHEVDMFNVWKELYGGKGMNIYFPTPSCRRGDGTFEFLCAMQIVNGVFIFRKFIH